MIKNEESGNRITVVNNPTSCADDDEDDDQDLDGTALVGARIDGRQLAPSTVNAAIQLLRRFGFKNEDKSDNGRRMTTSLEAAQAEMQRQALMEQSLEALV